MPAWRWKARSTTSGHWRWKAAAVNQIFAEQATADAATLTAASLHTDGSDTNVQFMAGIVGVAGSQHVYYTGYNDGLAFGQAQQLSTDTGIVTLDQNQILPGATHIAAAFGVVGTGSGGGGGGGVIIGG